MGLLDILGVLPFRSKRAEQPQLEHQAAMSQPENQTTMDTLSPDGLSGLRDLYVSTKAMCDSLDQADTCASVGHPNHLLTDILQTDFMRFFLHLAIADGELNPAETFFMNTVLGCNRTVGEWVIVAVRLEVKAMAHTNEAPFSLRVMHHVGRGLGIDVNDTVAPIFERLGNALILVDGQAAPEELERLEAYMADIRHALESSESQVAAPGYPLTMG